MSIGRLSRMARLLRIEFPHAICHVTSRGTARQSQRGFVNGEQDAEKVRQQKKTVLWFVSFI
jgi:hypothetical protein